MVGIELNLAHLSEGSWITFSAARHPNHPHTYIFHGLFFPSLLFRALKILMCPCITGNMILRSLTLSQPLPQHREPYRGITRKVLPNLGAWLKLDIYSAVGIIALLISSMVLIFIVIGNWSLVASGGGGGYYLVVMVVASAAPLAMLLLYLASIRGNRIGLRSGKVDVRNDIKIGEELVATEQPVNRREIEVMSAVDSEQKGGSAGQARAPHGESIHTDNNKQIDIKGIVKEEVARTTTDLISKINGFSQEILGIKKELEDMRNTVENAMIDIRNLLSEISNPFNYMRRFATNEEIEELGLTSNLEEGIDRKENRKQGIETKAEARRGPGKADEHGSNMYNKSIETIMSTESTDIKGLNKGLVEIFSKEASVSRLMRMILFVGDNLSTLGKDGLLGIVELGVSSGVIPRESIDIFVKVVSLIESTKIPPKRLAITLHRLAKSIGISDKEAEFLAMALSEG